MTECRWKISSRLLKPVEKKPTELVQPTDTETADHFANRKKKTTAMLPLDIPRKCSGCLVATVLFTFLPLSTSAADVIDIGDRNQIFIDGRYIESAKDVRIEVCRPIKTNEKCFVGRIGGYSSIMKPDGQYRLWSALTKDGVHWRKVSSGTLPEPDDILGVYFSGATVFVDPKAPPSERYKMFDGMRNTIRASADGTNWKMLHEGVFPAKARYPLGMDSHNVCFYDTRIDKYVAYVRVNKVYKCPPERVPYYKKLSSQRFGAEDRYARRTIGRAVTDDLSKFPMPEVVLEPDEKDPIFGGVKMMDFLLPASRPIPLRPGRLFPVQLPLSFVRTVVSVD